MLGMFPRVRNPPRSQCCDRGRLKPKRFDMSAAAAARKLRYAAGNTQTPEIKKWKIIKEKNGAKNTNENN